MTRSELEPTIYRIRSEHANIIPPILCPLFQVQWDIYDQHSHQTQNYLVKGQSRCVFFQHLDMASSHLRCITISSNYYKASLKHVWDQTINARHRLFMFVV